MGGGLRTIFITAKATPSVNGHVEWVEVSSKSLPELYENGFPVISVVVPIKPFHGEAEWLNDYIDTDA